MRVCIYVLLDAEGRRRYVGKTINPKRRLTGHRRRFPWAISLEVLETCDETTWPSLERFWIAHGRAIGWPLENISDGGDSRPAWYQPSNITRARISAANRGKTLSADRRVAFASYWAGKTRSPETRAKMSAIARDRLYSPETRAKLSAAASARALSADTRAKIGVASQRNMSSLEARAKIAAANRARRGWRHTPAARAKMSEASRNRSTDTHAKLSEAALRQTRMPNGRYCAKHAEAAV